METNFDKIMAIFVSFSFVIIVISGIGMRYADSHQHYNSEYDIAVLFKSGVRDTIVFKNASCINDPITLVDGTIKNNKKNNYSHIQPKKNYVLCEPTDEDFADTKFIFQIPVAAINPQDNLVRKMKIKPNDWVIVLPNCAVPITVKRHSFWMICIEDVLVINRGEHRVAINRKRVSDKIRMASRKETVQLN